VLDLSTNAGWQAVAALAAVFDATTVDDTTTQLSDGTTAYSLGTATTVVTDDNGDAAFSNLPIGLYLVQETSTPSTLDGKPVAAIPSLPFLVTVPITSNNNLENSSSTTWNYDVNVYPKNSISNVTKAVDDSQVVQVGDDTTWTVSGTIALPGDGSDLKGFDFSDTLDSRLTYNDGSARVSIVDPTTGEITATLDSTDFTATMLTDATDASASNPALPAHTLWVTLTATGLAKLEAAPHQNAVLTFTTTATGAGDIQNTATLYPDGPNTDETWASVPSNTVDQKFGGAKVTKTDSVSGAVVAGAVFKVFSYYPQAKGGDTTCSSADIDVNTAIPVTIAPQVDGNVGTNDGITWTTGSDGTLTIMGLRASDYANGASITTSSEAYIQYCLVEVQAPAGYSLLAQPVPFTVNASDITVNSTNPTVAAEVVPTALGVKDVEVNGGFTLPFTGSTGTALIFTFGGLLVVAAIVVAMIARRRAANRAKESSTTTL
jgi:fimbrial isopeptide formation D2 family protein